MNVYTILQPVKCEIELCLKKQCTYLKFKIVLLLKTANHHLSLQWTVIFLLVEGLKYFKNYQNETETWSEQTSVGKMTLTDLLHKVCFTNLRFVKEHSICKAQCAKLLQLCLFETLWMVACQAPLSLGFSRQEYWSGLPYPPPGDPPDPGIEPRSLMSPALAGGLFTTSATLVKHKTWYASSRFSINEPVSSEPCCCC